MRGLSTFVCIADNPLGAVVWNAACGQLLETCQFGDPIVCGRAVHECIQKQADATVNKQKDDASRVVARLVT
jgi:hypothetical protein